MLYQGTGCGMLRNLCIYLAAAICFAALRAPARAQSPQFLPEVDAHATLNTRSRVYVQAKDDRDEGVSDQFSIGPSVQFYLKPILKLKEITAFDLDDAKARALVVELGYRYLTAPDEAPTNRMEPVLTTHFGLTAGFLLSDRNRADLDWKGGQFNWRYRNRLEIERSVSIKTYHLIPYIAAEPYYVEEYKKWSTTDLYAGALFPLSRHVQSNLYYEHANNTGKAPNEPDNYVGVALELYFRQQR